LSVASWFGTCRLFASDHNCNNTASKMIMIMMSMRMPLRLPIPVPVPVVPLFGRKKRGRLISPVTGSIVIVLAWELALVKLSIPTCNYHTTVLPVLLLSHTVLDVFVFLLRAALFYSLSLYSSSLARVEYRSSTGRDQ